MKAFVQLVDRYKITANPLFSERRVELLAVVLTLLLLLQLLYSALRLSVLSEPESIAPASDVMAVSDPMAVEMVSAELSEELRARPLFWSSRRIQVVEPVASSQVKTAAASKSKLGKVKLVGIFGGGEYAGIIALVSVPFTVSLGLHARPLILTLYGEAWTDAIVPLQWLALAGILQPVSSACGWLLTSQGRPDILLRLGLISTLAAVLSFVIGLPYGIVGVSAAYAGACTLLLPLNWWLPTRLVGLPISQLVKSLFPSLVAGASMWPMQLLTRVWTVDLPVPAQLLVDAGAGLSMYAVVIMIWRPSAFRNLMALRHELSPNRKPA